MDFLSCNKSSRSCTIEKSLKQQYVGNYNLTVEILEGFKILPYVCQGGFWMYDRQIFKGKL